MKEVIVNEVFKMIRESEELGEGSMSTFDECYTDEELLEDLREHCSDLPVTTTAKDVFKFYLQIEGIRKERDNEVDSLMSW